MAPAKPSVSRFGFPGVETAPPNDAEEEEWHVIDEGAPSPQSVGAHAPSMGAGALSVSRTGGKGGVHPPPTAVAPVWQLRPVAPPSAAVESELGPLPVETSAPSSVPAAQRGQRARSTGPALSGGQLDRRGVPSFRPHICKDGLFAALMGDAKTQSRAPAAAPPECTQGRSRDSDGAAPAGRQSTPVQLSGSGQVPAQPAPVGAPIFSASSRARPSSEVPPYAPSQASGAAARARAEVPAGIRATPPGSIASERSLELAQGVEETVETARYCCRVPEAQAESAYGRRPCEILRPFATPSSACYRADLEEHADT